MSDLPDSAAQPLVSLCLIVGNVEEYIDRCLTSFAPLADEIVVVRAIGNQVPDGTLEIARAKFGARTFEYTNAPGHEDWPHVDDFAAARQMSFDMARGEYCFWCDSDDVLVPGAAELVREHAERGGYPGFLFPYEIFGRGITVPRERMVLKGSGKWLFPVHECFRFDLEVELVSDERVVVQHLPKPSKTGSSDRNLRILESIPRTEMSAGLLFHLVAEYRAAGRQEDCVETAIEALTRPELGKPERYELLQDLARMSKDPNTQRAFLVQAYGVDPTRREALGTLATISIDYGKPDEALAFARQMLATERPAAWSWNDRTAVYGWLGYEIAQQAMRANELFADAERVRRGVLGTATTPIISLVHATRGRPRQASIARKMWLDLAEHPEAVEHLFVIDIDDERSRPLCRMHHLLVEPKGCVHAWNEGAKATIGKVLVQLSDDWVPPAKWDTMILERLATGILDRNPESAAFAAKVGKSAMDYVFDNPDCEQQWMPEDKKAAVLAVSDGHRTDGLLCMAIMTRARLEAQNGLWFHPEFFGVYSDNWFSHCAYRDGVVIEAQDLVFEHKHPAWDDSPLWDATYARQNDPKRYAEGSEVYGRLLEQEQKGILNWALIPGWFDYPEVYDAVIAGARINQIRRIVEVGCWMGQSMVYLAQGLQRAALQRPTSDVPFPEVTLELYAVDTFQGEPEQPAHLETVAAHGGSIRAAFEGNLRRAGVAEMVNVIESLSWEAADRFEDGSLDFVFIDAGHDYESVRKDIAAWLPKIAPGGVLAGHDYPWHEVARAVGEAFLPEAVKTSGRCWMVTVGEEMQEVGGRGAEVGATAATL